MDGGYVGAKGAVQGGGRGGGSMGVTVCAVCPSGPVSLEIRLTRWCRALIINEPNFFIPRYPMVLGAVLIGSVYSSE